MSTGAQTRLSIIPRDQQPVVPWRNGGGTTRIIAVDPPAAGSGDSFRWRVSIARIEQDGPFSHFPGVDRTLWLLSGKGLTLDFEIKEIMLDTPLAAASFSGDDKVTARLHDGPTEDLNVMADRARVQATSVLLSMHRAGEWHRTFTYPGEDVLYVISGDPVLHMLGRPEQQLHAGEALRIDHGKAGRRIALASGPEPASVLVANFTALDG